MDIIEISEDNLDDFREYLGEDLSEDVKRVYYNGIGATDSTGNTVGAFVYELLNSESEEDTKSRICMLKSDDNDIFNSLENYYTTNSIQEEEIVESFYRLADEAEATTLSEHGFSKEKKEDDILTVTLKEIGETKFGKHRKLPDYIGNINDLSVLQFRGAVKQVLFKGHKGNMEDIPFLPKVWFDNRISACVTSGDNIPGLFLIRKTPSGVLIPALLFAYGPEFKFHIGYMISYAIQQALKLYHPDTVIKIPRSSAAAKALTEKIMPDKSGAEIFFGTRKEQ